MDDFCIQFCAMILVGYDDLIYVEAEVNEFVFVYQNPVVVYSSLFAQTVFDEHRFCPELCFLNPTDTKFSIVKVVKCGEEVCEDVDE